MPGPFPALPIFLREKPWGRGWSKRWLRILIICTSCKTSYNVLSHSHWGLGQFVGGGGGSVEIPGGVKKRESPDFRSPEVGISAPDLRLGCLWTDDRPSLDRLSTDYRPLYRLSVDRPSTDRSIDTTLTLPTVNMIPFIEETPALLRCRKTAGNKQWAAKPYKMVLTWAQVTKKKQEQAQVNVSTIYFYISTF